MNQSSHVGAGVDASFGVFWKGNFESLLDILQHLLILLAADERNRQTLRSEPTSTSDAVQIRVRIGRQIVIDGQVDPFDVDTTTEDVGCDADPLVELFEFLVAFDTMIVSPALPALPSLLMTYRSSWLTPE